MVEAGHEVVREDRAGEDRYLDDSGQAYMTNIIVWLPRDPGRFSGTIIVEPLHQQGAPPVFMSTCPYITRSGHGWACVGSQKVPLDFVVKPRDPQYYSALHIEPAAEAPLLKAPSDDDTVLELVNQASNAILSQAGGALRSGEGPCEGYDIKHLVLGGHSQTGGVVTRYITQAHFRHGLEGGAPIYDGFFPAGSPRSAFGPRDVPIVQVLSEGDVFDQEARFPDGLHGRRYRRPDSDDPDDRFRLYELAGTPHMGTRYPPYNNPERWQGLIGDTSGVTMNSMPHGELFSMALHHLVRWVADGVTPPRAQRLELTANGRYIAKDQYGNSRGGVRTAQLDVPHATYYSTLQDPDGIPRREPVGFEVPFDAATMRRIYGTPSNYEQLFNRRLDELIAAGWFLGEDAPGMREEAAAQKF